MSGTYITKEDDDAKGKADRLFGQMRDAIASKGRELYKMHSQPYRIGYKIRVNPIVFLYGGLDRDDALTIQVEERHMKIEPDMMERIEYHSKASDGLGTIFSLYMYGMIIPDPQQSMQILGEISGVVLPTTDTWTKREADEIEERIGYIPNQRYNTIAFSEDDMAERLGPVTQSEEGWPTESDYWLAKNGMLEFFKTTREEFGNQLPKYDEMEKQLGKWSFKPEKGSQGETRKSMELFEKTLMRTLKKRKG